VGGNFQDRINISRKILIFVGALEKHGVSPQLLP